MTPRNATVVIWVALLALSLPTWAAVDTKAIDSVLQKSVLTSRDLRVIDEFVAQAVKNVLRTKDDTKVAEDRAILLSRVSTQGQYAQQFSESALKHIAASLDLATALPEDRASIATMNLLILVHDLKDVSLVDLALDRLSEPRAPVAFWAASIATSETMVAAINRHASSDLAQRVEGRLSGLVSEGCSPHVLSLITKFASALQGIRGQDMLLAIADLRMAQYEQWSVENEPLDTTLLKSLCTRINQNTSDRERLAMRFAQLYSYVIQRYAKGTNSLRELQKRRTLGVIAEVEDKCIGTILGAPSSALMRALERQDMTLLLAAHDALLGSRERVGSLVTKLQFSYGRAADGSDQKWPKLL
ncbi:MAG: hypothetical protein IIA65_01415 [Planctomycetes bacterium]|nr:hypothetical protein [Planctomycetota bacterium]